MLQTDSGYMVIVDLAGGEEVDRLRRPSDGSSELWWSVLANG